MQQLKRLALVTAGVTALVCAVGSSVASATILTAPAGTQVPAGTIVKGELEKGMAVLETLGPNAECAKSTFEGEVTNEGGAAITVGIQLKSLTFAECAICEKVMVLKTGSLEVHTEGAFANANGTVTGTGQEITTICMGLHCRWTTNNTHLGVLTGGAVGILAVNAIVPRTGGAGGALCGGNIVWKGTYKFTAPAKLSVD